MQVTFQHTRVAQKVMPHNFFLGNYLFRMYEIHAQYNWMFPLHMLFFHIISIYVYGLMPVRNKACTPSLYQLVSFSRSHVLTAWITLSLSSNLVPRSVSFSGPKRWKSEAPDHGYRGDGEAQSNQIWWLHPGFVDLCEGGRCHAESTCLLDSC